MEDKNSIISAIRIPYARTAMARSGAASEEVEESKSKVTRRNKKNKKN